MTGRRKEGTYHQGAKLERHQEQHKVKEKYAQFNKARFALPNDAVKVARVQVEDIRGVCAC